MITLATTATLLSGFHCAILPVTPQAMLQSIVATETPLVNTAYPWLRTQFATINQLQADWDCYGADPIGTNVIRSLFSALDNDLPPDAIPGHIVPGSDGSLQIEWHLNRVSLGLIADADGILTSWIQVDGDDTSATGVRARDLFRAIAAANLAKSTTV